MLTNTRHSGSRLSDTSEDGWSEVMGGRATGWREGGGGRDGERALTLAVA